MKTQTLTFKKQTIQFGQFGNEVVIPAKFLGKAIGYAKDGESLINLLSSTWRKRFEVLEVETSAGVEGLDLGTIDGLMITDEALGTFKKDFGIQKDTSPKMLLLTPSGVIKVLTRSRSTTAIEFRNFLARSGKELLGNRKLTAKKLGKAFKKGSKTPVQKSLPLTKPGAVRSMITAPKQKSVSSVQDILVLAKELKKYGGTDQECAELIKTTASVAIAKYKKDNKITQMITPDGTVPPNGLVSLSKNALATPQGNYRVVNQIEQYHPDFSDWHPASEIGREYGLKGDLVKKYMARICEEAGVDLPNNDAKEYVRQNNGAFPPPDEKGFIIYKPAHGLGIALVMRMDGNQMNWRNYWSPDVVNRVKQMIESDQKFIKNGGSSASKPVKVAPPAEIAEAEIVQETPAQPETHALNG